MTLDARVNAIARFGFTERQSRFLVTVLLHAGVCVPRQYATFAGTAYGHKSTCSSTAWWTADTRRRIPAFTTARASTTCTITRSIERLATRTAGIGDLCQRRVRSSV